LFGLLFALEYKLKIQIFNSLVPFLFFVFFTFFQTKCYSQWTSIKDINGGPILCLAQNDSIVFAGTGDGIFASLDSGQTWEKRNNGLNGKFTSTIYIHQNTVFLSNENGIYRTENWGGSWNKLAGGIPNTHVTGFAALDNKIFASALNSGVYFSENNGTNWKAYNDSLSNQSITAISVFDNTIYIGTSSSKLYVSEFSKGYWKNQKINNTRGEISQIARDKNKNIFIISKYGGLAIHDQFWGSYNVYPPLDLTVYSMLIVKDKLYIGTIEGGVFSTSISDIKKMNWKDMGLGKFSVNYLAAFKETIFAAANWDGIFGFSQETGTWNRLNLTLFSLVVRNVHVFNGTVFAATSDGLFQSLDNGVTWTKKEKIGDSNVLNFKSNLTDIFALTDSKKIFRKHLSEPEWNEVIFPSVEEIINMEVFDSLLFVSAPSKVYVVSINNLKIRESTLGLSGQNIGKFCSLGTKIFGMQGTTSVLMSDNLGKSWKPYGSGLENQSLRTIFSSGSDLFIGTAIGGIFKSTDGGLTWKRKNKGIITNSNIGIYSFMSSGNIIFTGLELGGVYYSIDQGENWIEYNDGFENKTGVNVYSLAIAGSNLIAGLNSTGVRICNSGTILTISFEKEKQNLSFGFLPSYPNPFNPSTLLSYKTSSQSMVRLQIFDQLGRLITELVKVEQVPGYHSVTWNGTDKNGILVSSGIYFCRLINGKNTASTKITFIK